MFKCYHLTQLIKINLLKYKMIKKIILYGMSKIMMMQYFNGLLMINKKMYKQNKMMIMIMNEYHDRYLYTTILS